MGSIPVPSTEGSELLNAVSALTQTAVPGIPLSRAKWLKIILERGISKLEKADTSIYLQSYQS